MRKKRKPGFWTFRKLNPYECHLCHVTKVGPRYWHLWWCPVAKFVRVI